MKRAAFVRLTALGVGVFGATWSEFHPQPAIARESAEIAQLRQANVNGAVLTYQEQGQGRPVVFVHGALSDLRVWEPEREAVASKYRFIALTQRYFGPGAWPDAGAKFSMRTHVDDLAAFVRGLGAGPVDLVGWSYSGPIVLLAAIEHPDLVRSVFSFEPIALSYVSDPTDAKAVSDDSNLWAGPVVTAVKANDLVAASKLLLSGVNGQPDFDFEHSPAAFRSMWADNARTLPIQFGGAPPPPPLTCAALGQLKMPVAIGKGEFARPSFGIPSDTAARCIPGAKLVVIPGGHHLAPVQSAPAFNAALIAFLQSAR